MFNKNMEWPEKPRMGKFSEKNGSYEQGFKVSSTVLNPGDSIVIEQYFTGYGNIRRAKTVFFPISDIFDKEKSYVLHSIKIDSSGLHTFGGSKDGIQDTGVSFSLQGMKNKGWEESTMFMDIDNGEDVEFSIPQLMSELKLGEAPFKYHLTTSKNILPGPYSLEFHFIYFNGDAWKSSVKKIDFKVQNFFEQFNKEIFFLGIFFTSMAFIKAWAYPFFFE